MKEVRGVDISQAGDAAIFLVAAFAGLRRGEVLALRWRDVDFAAETLRVEQAVSTVGQEFKSTTSGRIRSVPMMEAVAAALDRLSQRDRFTGRDDLVFVGEDGRPLEGSALRRRYVAAAKRAGLRPLTARVARPGALPCRRSRVRVPSSASLKHPRREFRLYTWSTACPIRRSASTAGQRCRMHPDGSEPEVQRAMLGVVRGRDSRCLNHRVGGAVTASDEVRRRLLFDAMRWTISGR